MNDGIWRKLFEGPVGPMVVVDGRPYLWFGGTAYLGLQARPEVIAAAQDAVLRYGLHPGSARAGFGTTPPLLDSERAIAAFFGTPAAVHVASGWAATGLMLGALPLRRWRAFHDESAHHSSIEALQLAAWPRHAFRHRDPTDLADRIGGELRPGETPLLVTDGVFAGTGALAPLPEYRGVLDAHPGAVLCIDDAHGFGVLGARGRGTAEHFGLELDLDDPARCTLLAAGTASKAFGAHGGIFAASERRVEGARSNSPWHAGSTPPTNPVAAATATAIDIARRETALRERLRANAATLRSAVTALGVTLAATPAPILAIPCRDAAEGERRHEALRADGILVPVLSDYGGLRGTALRVAVFATHDASHLERLVDALRRHL